MQFSIGSYQLAVNVPNWATLRAQITQRFDTADGFALATLNLDHLVKLRSDMEFRAAYKAQDFVVADGNPIVWMSRLAQNPVTLMPGSDLILPLCFLAADHKVPVGLVGTTDDSLKQAAAALEAQVPGLQITQRIAPPFGFDPQGGQADDILRHLENAGIRLCFVALGAPKQELFAARGRTVAPSVGFASIGAGLDFLSGSQKRAPRWVRALQQEWLWRMLENPSRLFLRYLRCFAILPGHMWASWTLRRRR
ncbi:WecB/TagA/CpsF family glycosyltransferase [Thalassobius sp. S69A]|uniref:WecB/TagA/CpsF family glycosyltransferase n=1 Tax=unclassified Thalassovita TaxID=2619711 RepID=UPI000C0D8E80|nr:glycosyltransferase [Paracoccaceae bacterium]MBT24841.1 glycosyltransferase [Paracoccaceae bacterium]